MSLVAVSRAAAARDVARNANEPPPQTDWSNDLVHLVPTEAVGFFTGALALCAGYGWGWTVRWAVLAGIALCIPFWVFFNYWDSLPEEARTSRWRQIPFASIVFAILAFGAWAITIPETPFLQWHGWDLKFAPFATLVAVVLLTIARRTHDWWRSTQPAHAPAPAPPPHGAAPAGP